jgi:hypothetical protein
MRLTKQQVYRELSEIKSEIIELRSIGLREELKKPIRKELDRMAEELCEQYLDHDWNTYLTLTMPKDLLWSLE